HKPNSRVCFLWERRKKSREESFCSSTHSTVYISLDSPIHSVYSSLDSPIYSVYSSLDSPIHSVYSSLDSPIHSVYTYSSLDSPIHSVYSSLDSPIHSLFTLFTKFEGFKIPIQDTWRSCLWRSHSVF
uniref:Uncharacterized protein n=1 Tax=Astyanax mexicanus TaxID=7994 RepID=A0A3B1JB01_ASTMX